MRDTAVTCAAVPVRKTSSATNSSQRSMGRSSTVSPISSRSRVMSDRRVMPSSTLWLSEGVATTPRRTRKMFSPEPSLT